MHKCHTLMLFKGEQEVMVALVATATHTKLEACGWTSLTFTAVVCMTLFIFSLPVIFMTYKTQ